MQCPLCKIEAAIANSRYKLEGDNSPDIETKLYIEQDMTCRSPNCINYKKVIATVKHELQLSKDTSEIPEEAEEANDEELLTADAAETEEVEETETTKTSIAADASEQTDS